jgi:hypothetical protein
MSTAQQKAQTALLERWKMLTQLYSENMKRALILKGRKTDVIGI